jgi:F-type H+-transporting ATPase subunit delta
VPSAAAFRYARALVDVVTAPGVSGAQPTLQIDPQKVVEELKTFEKLLSDNPELRIVSATPAIPPERKRAVIDQIAPLAGLSNISRNFIKVVLDHERMGDLTEIIEGFQTLLNERLGIAVAEVTSARPLEEGEKILLASALKVRTGRQVQVSYSQDPSLIAGVVARIGSTVYDGSVRGQLERLRSELTSRA